MQETVDQYNFVMEIHRHTREDVHSKRFMTRSPYANLSPYIVPTADVGPKRLVCPATGSISIGQRVNAESKWSTVFFQICRDMKLVVDVNAGHMMNRNCQCDPLHNTSVQIFKRSHSGARKSEWFNIAWALTNKLLFLA